MKKIACIVKRIDEELEDAKTYAEDYLTMKADGNSFASKYKSMAEDELRHAMVVHDYAVSEIENLRKVYVPPVDMEEQWNLSHKRYVEREAWIKQMLSM